MLISLPGDPPSIILNSECQVSLPEESVTFCVEATGTGPLQYRWFCDMKVVEEAEGPVLTLTGVEKAHGGDYQCQVTNLFGKAVSGTATLRVGECTCIYLRKYTVLCRFKRDLVMASHTPPVEECTSWPNCTPW